MPALQIAAACTFQQLRRVAIMEDDITWELFPDATLSKLPKIAHIQTLLKELEVKM